MGGLHGIRVHAGFIRDQRGFTSDRRSGSWVDAARRSSASAAEVSQRVYLERDHHVPIDSAYNRLSSRPSQAGRGRQGRNGTGGLTEKSIGLLSPFHLLESLACLRVVLLILVLFGLDPVRPDYFTHMY